MRPYCTGGGAGGRPTEDWRVPCVQLVVLREHLRLLGSRQRGVYGRWDSSQGRAEIRERLLLPAPLKHVLQAGRNLRFLMSRGQIPPLRSRMRERCCLATKWICWLCKLWLPRYKAQINILWVVNCQIYFLHSQSSLSCIMMVCQENALRCDMLLATAGKAETIVCIMEVGMQDHKRRKYRERLKLARQSAWNSHH